MKKIFSLVLVALLVLTSLAGCGAKAEELKFGTGVYAYYEKATSADGETVGAGEAVINVASVLLDAEGKIVKCVIDTADNTISYTSEGKAVVIDSFRTKYEKGADYGMVAYGGAKKEWFEQIDAFTALIAGKTIDEVKALVASNNKGTEDVITAGCTIAIDDYVKAVEKAVANATASTATKDATLKLGIVTTATAKDATEEAEGAQELDTTIVASAVDAKGKVIVTDTDAVSVKFAFDTKGATTHDVNAAIKTKKEQGADYGMAAYGKDLNGDGVVKEWNEQAAAFNAACAGKTAEEITALAIDTGYGVADLQTAGCTIHVGDMVKAAVKAATVA